MQDSLCVSIDLGWVSIDLGWVVRERPLQID